VSLPHVVCDVREWRKFSELTMAHPLSNLRHLSASNAATTHDGISLAETMPGALESQQRIAVLLLGLFLCCSSLPRRRSQPATSLNR
jgi:hypothetical protein